MCFAPQWRALLRHLNLQKWSEPLVFLTFSLGNVLRATTACTFSTSQLPKVVRRWGALHILTWKCASRHSDVHFFDISRLPKVVRRWGLRCFVHFDLEMCFAPQRRALFRRLNFQKRSDHGVFCTFWLGNVLRTTTACNFSSLIWPAGSAPPTFRPSGATIHWKNTVFRDFPTFSRICIFFLLTLSLLWSSLFWSFSSLIFSLLIFLFSSLVFSSLVFSSHLFSSLLFSSLLWLFPPLLVNFVESLTSKFLSPTRHTYTLMCIYLEAQRHIGSSCSARDAPNGEPVISNVYMKDWSGNTSKVWKPFLMVDHCVADSVGRWRM